MLKDFIQENPHEKLMLLWFNEKGELCSNCCYSNKLSSQAKKMLTMRVMEYEKNDDEGWIEVWLM